MPLVVENDLDLNYFVASMSHWQFFRGLRGIKTASIRSKVTSLIERFSKAALGTRHQDKKLAPEGLGGNWNSPKFRVHSSDREPHSGILD